MEDSEGRFVGVAGDLLGGVASTEEGDRGIGEAECIEGEGCLAEVEEEEEEDKEGHWVGAGLVEGWLGMATSGVQGAETGFGEISALLLGISLTRDEFMNYI
jgi:hypothetical protein